MSDYRPIGDLSKLTKAELEQHKQQALTAMDEILDADAHTMEHAKAARVIGKDIEKIKAQLDRLAQDEDEVTDSIKAARELRAQHAQDAGDDLDTNEPAVEPEVEAVEDAAPVEGELVTAAVTPRGKTRVEDVIRKTDKTLNLSLRQLQDDNKRTQLALPSEPEMIMTAGVDIPGVASGSRISSNAQLADAFMARARGLSVTRGEPNWTHSVASIKNEFEHHLSPNSSLAEVEDVMSKLTNPDRLWANRSSQDEGASRLTIAGGGWCAPSINRYQFFNIACESGMIDLPTFGAERGGVNFPTSPSLADVFTGEFTSATNPWLWTETDDIATVTGDPNKPCVRVPCPAFMNVRLECYGICLTAGNLIDWAYPEAVQNQIRLLMSAHYRATNQRYLAQIAALASPTITGLGAAGSGVISPVLGAVELQAMDYRTRYGMCDTDVIEVVLPYWILGAMRSDGIKRTGVDSLFCMSNAQLADWFDCRNIRAQFVSDFQVRASGQIGFSTPATAWPTTVNFFMWAPGTVVRGNGLSLNLGVIRDSVLNAENDHTALWMEECHLIARFGHEIRLATVPICTDGTTGANDLTACGL